MSLILASGILHHPLRESKLTRSASISRASVTDKSSRHPQSLVTFIIGKGHEMQTFQVHRDFAVFHSSFFTAAFEGPFQEGETPTSALEDVEGFIFGLLVHWLYTKKMDQSIARDYPDFVTPVSKLWVLAERCCIPDLQNECMKTMLYEISRYPLASLKALMNYAYGMAKSDVLKRLAAATAALRLTAKEWEGIQMELPPQLVMDASLRMKEYWLGQDRMDLEDEEFMVRSADEMGFVEGHGEAETYESADADEEGAGRQG